MKNKFVVVCLLVFYVLLINLPAFAQNPKIPKSLPKEESQKIKSIKSKKEQSKFYQPTVEIESFLDPSASFINFDEVNIVQENSVLIPPNRYTGVSFYSPYYNNTYLTKFHRYSYPNSLIVGYTDSYNIYSMDAMVIEFDQVAKDVSFLWGTIGYYNSGQIQIYSDNNQLVATVPVSFNGYWVPLS